MWLAREKDGSLYLFESKPEYGPYSDDSGDNVLHFTGWHTELDERGNIRVADMDNIMEIHDEEWSWITLENSPVEVRMSLKRCDGWQFGNIEREGEQ